MEVMKAKKSSKYEIPNDEFRVIDEGIETGLTIIEGRIYEMVVSRSISYSKEDWLILNLEYQKLEDIVKKMVEASKKQRLKREDFVKIKLNPVELMLIEKYSIVYEIPFLLEYSPF